jgi:hypothetical protein
MIFAESAGLTDRFARNKAEYREMLAERFAMVNRHFEDHFKDTQLSGRPGLNVVTGNLHGSIRSTVTVDSESVTGEVYNRNASYWYWHQIGASAVRTSAWGKPTNPYMWALPKRLTFWEYFTEHGPQQYGDAWRVAAQRLAA